jgi:prepilin-type N-terminal cleavage/methylation domain-containing protein
MLMAGFTLIELSIVLVIIGLIVGGILVGQDLIKAAAIRSQIAQIEKLNAAVNTFRMKYNAVPGDIIPAVAVNYGLLQLTNTTGAQGMGDNNGVIEDGSAAGGGSNTNTFGGEISAFWRHLSDANLVDGQFGTTSNSVILQASGLPTGNVNNISQSIPTAKLGRSLSVTIMSGEGTNYYDLLPITKIATTGVYTIGAQGMTPTEASNIDTKIDDGQPETGVVIALALANPTHPDYPSPGPAPLIGGVRPSSSGSSALNTCVIGTGATPTDTYNLVPSTGGNDPSCALAIRFQ